MEQRTRPFSTRKTGLTVTLLACLSVSPLVQLACSSSNDGPSGGSGADASTPDRSTGVPDTGSGDVAVGNDSSTGPDTGTTADAGTDSATGDASDAASDASSDASSDAAADADASSAPPALSTLCPAYCSAVVGGCTDMTTTGDGNDYRQYQNSATCLGACLALGESDGGGIGRTGDTTGNTVSCRYTYANAAFTDGGPDTIAQCDVAGPFGGNYNSDTTPRCTPAGDPVNFCPGFCSLILAKCANGGGFSSFSDCENTCANYQSDPSLLLVGQGTPNSSDGGSNDILECHEYWLTAAFAASAADAGASTVTTACTNAGLNSPVCD